MSPPLLHPDGLKRCPWPKTDPLYVAYHDDEWGVPEYDDRALYEKLVLDGFQAGLSWITILRKRDNFRRAFDGFDPAKIARYRPAKVEKLMQDAGIVRNRLKIEGAVLSAHAYLEVMEKGPGFSAFLWNFLDGAPKVNHFRSTKQVPAETAAVASDLEGACRARLQIRRTDHRVRLHAGGRHGERPSRGLPLSSDAIDHTPAGMTTAKRSVGRPTLNTPVPGRFAIVAQSPRWPSTSVHPPPHRLLHAPGSACCLAAASTCSIPRRSTSRSRTSPTASPAWRAGTARPSGRIFSRSPNTPC